MTQPLIDDYNFGVIVIGGKVFRSDLVITPKSIFDDWWRLEGHRLQIPDVRDYLAEEFDSVVIGTGYSGLMRVDPEVVELFKSKGCEVFIAKTKEAIKIYNRLVSKGKKVLAFFHLTC